MLTSKTRRIVWLALKCFPLLASLALSPAWAEVQNHPTPWSYDAGPSLTTPMGKELIELTAAIPDASALSQSVMGTQKFRGAFGPIPWRMQQKPNSVKILFIGQDGTHIAEAAGRPATAGFGGRAQDLAKYFGVGSSAAFINAFAFTIKGQYGTFDAPYVKTGARGHEEILQSSFVDNSLWLISQDPASPLVQWRNQLIDWIIRNNRKSLKLIVLFGGAARDSAATFVQSHGGTVGSRLSENDLATIKVPEQDVQATVQNYEVSVPKTAGGEDLYSLALGRQVNYKDQKGADLAEAKKIIAENPTRWIKEMVFSGGGIHGSGIIHPAQLGGFDINRKMEINGQKTISLKGLRLTDGTEIDHDILITQLPHPTALSMMSPSDASKAVAKGVSQLLPYAKKGWSIEPDAGFANTFSEGGDYRYSRADMGPEYYDFGAPASRMVNVSSAVRAGKNVIVFGSRDKASFMSGEMQNRLRSMMKERPEATPNPLDLWTTRARTLPIRNVFDSGPGESWAKLMKENLSEELIALEPENRDYAHYRGTFNKPKVIILADPFGYDDLLTGRALTGERGQLIHSVMNNVGVSDEYLILRTAPFSMRDKKKWLQIMEGTQAYREALIARLLKDNAHSVVWVADGAYATSELGRILGTNAFIEVDRLGNDARFGLDSLQTNLLKVFPRGRNEPLKRTDLPRSHLSFYSRLWEGTSGDRVITTNNPKETGKVFAVVAPSWATTQDSQASLSDRRGIQALTGKVESLGTRRGGEKVSDFVRRKNLNNNISRPRSSRPRLPNAS